MFTVERAFASFSVDDLAVAEAFYQRILGLPTETLPEGLRVCLGDGGSVFVYGSPFHVPPTHTVLNFIVDDVVATVAALATMGVKIMHYERADIRTDAHGVHHSEGDTGPLAVAWFADPAGNVHAVVQQRPARASTQQRA